MSAASPLTLTRFILKDVTLEESAKQELAILYSALQLACKITSNAMKNAGILEHFGLTGTQNVHGESVKKLDVIANEAFKTALIDSGQVSVLASEEEEDAIIVPEKHSGKYVVTFDPLDGSSNIEANVSVGSIFGIFKKQSAGKVGTREDCLQAGNQQISSGYALYGSSVIMVVTFGDSGVHGFTLDTNLGEFILSHPNIRVPEKGAIYSVNEGNSAFWSQPTIDYVNYCKASGDGDKKPYSARYIGSMVADVHRTLLYGGIFMYPADSRSTDGKLRYLYEVAPLSFIMERAGGLSSTGHQRCLSIIPNKVHLRTPVFMGSSVCVRDVEAIFKKQN
jgi:fructose-1,6-bisphosphatase I